MHHSSVSWKITLLYFFSWNYTWLGKRSPSKCRISDFRLLTWNFTNLYFDRLLSLKVYKISAKKVQRSYISWYWKSDTKFEQKPICSFKNDKNLVNFDLSTQFSKICTMICPFCARYIAFDQKKYRGVTFSDNEEPCKIWRENVFLVWKMTQGVW